MADKKIIIDVEDRASKKLAMLKRAMSEAGRAGTQLGRELSRVQPSTKQSGLGALADAILKSEKSLGNLSKMSKETTRAFEDMKNRAIAQQIKMLETWEKRVQKLTHAYNALGDSIKQFKADPNIQWTEANKSALADLEAKQRRVGIQLGNAQVNATLMREILDDYFGGGAGGGATAAAGGGRGGIFGMLGGMGMAKILGLAGLMWSAGQFGRDLGNKLLSNRIYDREGIMHAEAGAVGYSTSMLGRYQRGDFGAAFANVDPNVRRLYDEVTSYANVRDQMKLDGGALQVDGIWGVRHIAGWVNAIADRESYKRAKAIEYMDLKQAGKPIPAELMQYAAYAEKYFSEKQLEAQQMAEAIRGPSKVLYDTYAGQAGYLAEGYRTMGYMFDNRYALSGLGVQGNIQLMNALMGVAGRRGAQMFDDAAQLHTSTGMNLDVAGRVAGALGLSSGRMEAERQLEEIFGRGFARGMRDPKVLDTLGEYVASASYGMGGRGAVGMTGQLIADVSSAGRNDIYSMREAIGAMQKLDRIGSGIDPNSNINIERNVTNVLRSRGNYSALRAHFLTNNVTIQELMNAAAGDVNERLASYFGTDPSLYRELLYAKLVGGMEGMLTAESGLHDKFVAAGGSPIELMRQNPEARNSLTMLLEMSGMSHGEARSALDLLETGDARGWQRQAGSEFGPDLAGPVLRSQIDFTTLMAANAEKMGKFIFDKIFTKAQQEALEGYAKTLEDAKSSMIEARLYSDEFQKSLQDVNKAFAEFIDMRDRMLHGVPVGGYYATPSN